MLPTPLEFATSFCGASSHTQTPKLGQLKRHGEHEVRSSTFQSFKGFVAGLETGDIWVGTHPSRKCTALDKAVRHRSATNAKPDVKRVRLTLTLTTDDLVPSAS